MKSLSLAALLLAFAGNALAQCNVLPPVTANDTVQFPGGTATLTATGQNVAWYDAATGGNNVGSGNAFLTPFITATQTWYAEQTVTVGPVVSNGGMTQHTGTSQYASSTSTNAKMKFDVHAPSTLVSVKVYTDTPGYRLIELHHWSGTLLDTALVYITPDSMIVTLNFPLTPDTAYRLGTNAIVNQQIPNWGHVAPRLKRNNNFVSYPYAVDTLLTVTTSSLGSTLYFYFYDWHVATIPYDCTSDRAAATAYYDPTLAVFDVVTAGITVSPNPASTKALVQLAHSGPGVISVFDLAGRLMFTQVCTDHTTAIDVSALTEGLYTIRVQSDRQDVTTRLVVQR